MSYTFVSDPGIDDSIALALFVKLSGKDPHTLVSTFGNVPGEYTQRNAREFIAFMAPHWKYHRGADAPVKPLEHPWPDYFHGPDGVWNIHQEVSIDSVVDSPMPNDTQMISVGPMTDVYNAFLQRKYTELVVMGGAFNVPGNETPYAETNIAFDPDAAAYVFAHCQDMDVKILPLDVTKKVFWTKEKIQTIPETNEKNRWAKKLLSAWFANYGDQHSMNFDLHDPLAVYAIFFPENITWTQSGVEVITEGEKRGQTVLNAAHPVCNVALSIAEPQKVADHIFDIIFG